MRRQEIKRPDLAALDRERSKRALAVFLACGLAWAGLVYLLMHLF